MNLTVKRFVAGVVVAGAAVLAPAMGLAQAQTGQVAKSAEATRDELRQVLQQYPPSLGRVLVLDPTLLGNKAYLESYPPLLQFLNSRPEVARDPNYFFGDYVETGYVDSYARERVPLTPEMALRREAVNAWGNMFESMLVFGGLNRPGIVGGRIP